jgi:hypothetical protein
MFESIEITITRILRIQKKDSKKILSYIYNRTNKGGEVDLLEFEEIRVE